MGFWFTLFIVVAVFYALTKGFTKSPVGSSHKSFSEQDASFLVALMARIAKADGVVDSHEAAYVSRILDICAAELNDRSARDRLKRIFDEQKNATRSIYELAKMYKQSRFLSQKECESVVIYLLHLAYANGAIHPNEKAAIDEVARAFGMGDISGFYYSFEREFSRGSYRQNSNYNDNSYYEEKRINPYEVLGIPENSSFDEVKKRYRELSRKYHPDFLGSNASSDEVAKATKKTQEINEAYEQIKKMKGQ